MSSQFDPKKANTATLAVVGGIVVIVVIILVATTFVTIPSGHRGVKFYKIGGLDKETVYTQGLKIVAPWNTMHVYDVRIHSEKATMDVLSKDGANIGLDLTYRYRPVPSELGYLHDDLGPNYASTVIMPEVRSSAREVIGKYKPDELYSADRGKIQQQIFNTTKASLDKKHIQLDKILIRSIQLPKNITRYIEQKLQQEQKALEYKFRISREKQEAERKRIEAEGIKKQMQIINEGLTPNFLTYKGIEATQKLSESDNSKVIVIGGGDNGMPLILGGQ